MGNSPGPPLLVWVVFVVVISICSLIQFLPFHTIFALFPPKSIRLCDPYSFPFLSTAHPPLSCIFAFLPIRCISLWREFHSLTPEHGELVKTDWLSEKPNRSITCYSCFRISFCCPSFWLIIYFLLIYNWPSVFFLHSWTHCL